MSKVDLDDSWWNGVTNGLTNGQTDNAISRVAFATENDKTSWKRAEVSNISAIKSLGCWVVSGCIYDYSIGGEL